MEHFKLKLYRTSIEHHRPSINVRSLIPSTNCGTKETISQSANSESFRAKIGDTILTIFYHVSNSLHFHVKWRKARHFDARTVDSFFLKRIGEAHPDPEWPKWFKEIPQMFILSIPNCEWHCPVKSALESENISIRVWIFSVYPINVRHT